MLELERIENNINGELPNTGTYYEIIKIKEIQHPEDELNTFKDFMIGFLNNKELPYDDPKWEKILPEKVVRFTDQLEESDYEDESLSNIQAMIYKLQKIREWEWFSSKITADGFEVIVLGIFRGIFVPIIHHQGIPNKCFYFYTPNDGDYKMTDGYHGRDVLSYKKWNPRTYELR